MSSQFYFYMTPADMQHGFNRIAQCGSFLLLHSRSPSPEPCVLPIGEYKVAEKSWLYFYLTRLEFLQAIKMYEAPTQGYWAVDGLRSPVIELNLSFFGDRRIREGRLYFQTAFYDDYGNKVNKPESFLKWGSSVMAALKKTLQRDPARDSYIGAEALAMSKDGRAVLLSGLDKRD